MSPVATVRMRAARFRSRLGWLLLVLAGCLPFGRGKPEPPRTPGIVQRFADETSALGIPPSPPRLSDVTHTLARAVESLARSPSARNLAKQIDAEANAMERLGDGAVKLELEHAHRSLAAALQAVTDMKKPAGSAKERQRVVGEARRAIDVLSALPAANDVRAAVETAYRALARAMLIVTSGHDVSALGGELPALVARLAVEDSDQARRTGAQLAYAIARALEAMPTRGANTKHFADELRERARRLAGAAELDYSPLFAETLAIAVDALKEGAKYTRRPALASLLTEAGAAVGRITRDRPFALQRPAAQDAARLISDAITVAAAR